MTAQFSDVLKLRDTEYGLLAIRGEGLVTPQDYGINPVGFSTACWRGFYVGYCVEKEGYPGLVVHGPLQASLLLHFASEIRNGAAPRTFSFRAVAPIFGETTFTLNAVDAGSSLELWTADVAGRAAMTAKASW